MYAGVVLRTELIMWCKHCEQETFAMSVHEACKPEERFSLFDNYLFDKEMASLRDKQHFVYETLHTVYAGMHMLTFGCPVCGDKFKVGDTYRMVCISNKCGEISKASWSELWSTK